MEKILILGAGGHARSIIDTIEVCNSYNICGFVTEDDSLKDYFYKDYPVIGQDRDLKTLYNSGIKNAVVGIGFLGGETVRASVYQELKEIGFQLPNIIDPSAIIAGDVVMGEGNFIGKRAVINANSKIGNMCIINSGSIIEHDCIIGDFCHVSVGTVICGSCKIGDFSMIGANAVVIQECAIGSKTIVGAGSVVTQNIGNSKKYISGYRHIVTEMGGCDCG